MDSVNVLNGIHGLTSFFDDIETGMGNIVILDGLVIWLDKSPYENGLILRRYERDCIKLDVGRH